MSKLLLVFVPSSKAKAEAVLVQLEAFASAISCVLDGPLELEGAIPSREAERLAKAAEALERAAQSARVREGLARARAAGRRLGRPPKYSPEICARIASDRDSGASWGVIGRRYGIARSSVRSLYIKIRRAGDTHIANRKGRRS
jgi:putative DNA-invertase from lambdoid prophage Rac